MKHEYRKIQVSINRVFLIFNKKANSNFKLSRFMELESEIKKNRIPLESIFIVPEEHIPYNKIEEGDTFLIFGGDGTIHRFITEIFKNGFGTPLINICHLRGGTMNTVAECLSIPKTKEFLIKLGRKIAEKEKVEAIPRNPIVVRTEKEFLCGFIFGAILPYKFLEKYYSGRFLGPVQGILTLANSVYEAFKGKNELTKKEKCKLAFRKKEDGKMMVIDEEFLIIGGGTVHSFGLNFSNFPKAPEAEENFNIIAFSGNPVKLSLYLPLIYFGKLPEEAVNEVVDRVEIEFEKEIGFTVDGDLYKARRIELYPAPKVHFITA